MKFFLCLVVLAFVAVNADEKVETQEAEASQTLPLVLSKPLPLKPKATLAPYKPIAIKPVQPSTYAPITRKPLKQQPTLAPYKPTAKVIKPQATYAPLKVVPTTRKNLPNNQNADQSGAYVPWSA